MATLIPTLPSGGGAYRRPRLKQQKTLTETMSFFHISVNFHHSDRSANEVAQNDSEWPISPDSQLFPYFTTEMTWIGSKWAILVKFQQKLKYLSGILTDLH